MGSRDTATSVCPPAAGRREFSAAVFVVCTTVLAYLPSLSGTFLWNDRDYVTKTALRSVEGLGRIWTELGATEQYYPLLHSAFWAQHRLWGDNPLGYHIVTMLGHAAAAVLFALVLRRLTVPGAWIAALLFALHPVHVESVAWITEQKNTLSLVLYLGAAWVYLQFDATRRPRDYAAALALFFLSLLCKTVTATLPAALLVALWWKRGRLDLRRDIGPLAPWLVLGAAAGIFSSWVERNYFGAQGAAFDLPLPERGLVAGRAVWFYLGKLAWPSGLNFIYPRWTPDAADAGQWLFPAGVAALAIALWWRRRRTRAPLAAFLIFVGSLFPVLGFVNLYGALYSWVWDHWQYLPDLAPLALAGAALQRLGDWLAPRFRGGGPALLAALAGGYGILTWTHCGIFRNSETLYRATLARNPSCWLAHYNLATELSRIPGRDPEAIAEFEATLQVRPDLAEAHLNFGTVLARQPGRGSEAIAQYETALRIKPDLAEAHYSLGNALLAFPDRLPEALAHFEAALRSKPDLIEAHLVLGNVLAHLPGRRDEAVAHLEAALRIRPDYAEAHYNLANLLSNAPDRAAEAIAHFEAALRLKPDFADAHHNFGLLLAGLPNRRAEAIAHLEAAVRYDPNHLGARINLGVQLAEDPARVGEAIAHLEAAVRLRPEVAEAHFGLGLALLRTPGREREALLHFEAALRLRPDLEPAREIVKRLRTMPP